MPILSESLSLKIDVDSVLRGQGSDPAVIRSRNGKLVKIAEKALAEVGQLVEPLVIYQELPVASQDQDKMYFADGSFLQGKLIIDHLENAERVIILLCSIGEAIESRASEASASKLLYGLAIDGVGSAAVESLANSTCRYFSKQASDNGMRTTIPISPGMNGWPLREGQQQIFSILEQTGPFNIKLTEHDIMIPKKTLSMVVGIGRDVNDQGSTCDYCNMKDICQHRNGC